MTVTYYTLQDGKFATETDAAESSGTVCENQPRCGQREIRHNVVLQSDSGPSGLAVEARAIARPRFFVRPKTRQYVSAVGLHAHNNQKCV